MRNQPNIIIVIFGFLEGILCTCWYHDQYVFSFVEKLGDIPVDISFLVALLSVHVSIYTIAIPLSISSVYKAFDNYGVNKSHLFSHEDEYKFQLYFMPTLIIVDICLIYFNVNTLLVLLLPLILGIYSILKFMIFLKLVINIVIDTDEYIEKRENEVLNGLYE